MVGGTVAPVVSTPRHGVRASPDRKLERGATMGFMKSGLWLLVMVTACSGSRENASGSTSGSAVSTANPASELGEPPEPGACANDSECIAGPLFNPDDLCCDTGVPLTVHGRAYLEWVGRWRAASCGSAQCPMLPPPTPPRRCATVGRCVAGQCRNTCDSPAPGGGTGIEPTGLATDAPATSALPARLDLKVSIPGSAPTRWLGVTFEQVAGRGQLVGCETRERNVGCRATRRVELDAAQVAELGTRWQAIAAAPPCRARISREGWREFEIEAGEVVLRGRLPIDADALAPVDCFAQERFAGFLLGTWLGTTGPARP